MPSTNGKALARVQMVRDQLMARGVSDDAVLRAMSEVPRDAFVHPKLEELAYADMPLPISEGQTISQPYIVARMAELLDLESTDHVLEVGTGSGYAAAVLSRLVEKVYTVERYEQLARQAAQRLAKLGYNNVTVHHGDGTLGWREHAPYDAIMVTAGGPDIPVDLLEQMRINGRLIIPIGQKPHSQRLIRVYRLKSTEYQYENLGRVRFVPLLGQAGWDEEDIEALSA